MFTGLEVQTFDVWQQTHGFVEVRFVCCSCLLHAVSMHACMHLSIYQQLSKISVKKHPSNHNMQTVCMSDLTDPSWH